MSHASSDLQYLSLTSPCFEHIFLSLKFVWFWCLAFWIFLLHRQSAFLLVYLSVVALPSCISPSPKSFYLIFFVVSLYLISLFHYLSVCLSTNFLMCVHLPIPAVSVMSVHPKHFQPLMYFLYCLSVSPSVRVGRLSYLCPSLMSVSDTFSFFLYLIFFFLCLFTSVISLSVCPLNFWRFSISDVFMSTSRTYDFLLVGRGDS